jgi:hypothetical protein
VKPTTWLWPDHKIGKRESRKLREEHNALMNQSADLLAALMEMMDQAGEVYPHFESERGQANIAKARAAIARATGAA